MAIDHLEVCRMELRDFGEQVTVLPAQAAAFQAQMIFDDAVPETGIGQSSGHVGQPVFRCLPEIDAPVGAGTLIATADGTEYLVPNEGCIARRRGTWTVLRVVEQ